MLALLCGQQVHLRASGGKSAGILPADSKQNQLRDVSKIKAYATSVGAAIDSELYARGWVEKQFQTEILLDGHRQDSPTNQIDCFKNRVALEIEWNNKDPFYDRDLNNFRLLFDLRAVSVGVIITRCDHLQDIFDELGRGSSFGASTTHMSKLLPRIHGGSGGGCPLLVFGISRALYQED